MDDSRAVEKEFVDEFKNENNLGKILAYVKDTSKNLILCFRGNSGQVVTVYKKNHVFWEISKLNGGKLKYRLRFNFNHARYSKNWQASLKALKFLGWEQIKKTDKNDKIDVGYLKYDFEILEDRFLKISYNIINRLIDDYFDSSKKYDFFTGTVRKNKSVLLEKQRQQELYEKFNKPDSGDGYLIYDLEFVEKGNRTGNQPDFWAIKYEKGVPRKLVIGEVKSKESALSGKSGILEHLKAMVDYSKSAKITNRKEEAIKILKSYTKLGLKGLSVNEVNLLDDIVLDSDVEILIVLTDEAAEVYDNTWEQAILAIDSNIKIIKYSSDSVGALDKTGFGNIVLNNLVSKIGNDKFGYKVKDGRLYRCYYKNEEFNDFITQMSSPKYECHYRKYDEGLGKELEETPNKNGKYTPPKMAHVASSSRFCYLALRDGAEAIGGSDKVVFEKSCPINGLSGFPPQLDAYSFNKNLNQNIYVEAKCHEIFDEKITEMRASYKEYISDTSKKLGFNVPVNLVVKKNGYFNIPYTEFGFDRELYRFDFKQFLCHLLGIASNEKPATLVYLFFKPIYAEKQESIDKVFGELKEEIKNVFDNKYIQAFCIRHNITLKAVAEYSEVMEPLTGKNIIVLY